MRKSILSDAWKRFKEYFWIYLLTVVLLDAIIGLSNGNFGIIVQIQRLTQALRNGIFTKEAIMTPNSSLWQMMMIVDTGFVGVILSYFVANPLAVGVNKFFLESIKKKPAFELLLYPFKNNYRNIFFTSFLSNLILSFILAGIILLWGSIVSAEIAFMTSYSLITILLAILMIVTSIIFFVWTKSISYNFSMILYILAEHPDYNFTIAYALNKKMVKGKKWFIFKTEFWPFLAEMITTFLPIFITLTGIMMILFEVGGRAVTLIGLMSIVPMYFISLFFKVYEKSIWAGIYNELKKGVVPEKINITESNTEEKHQD